MWRGRGGALTDSFSYPLVFDSSDCDGKYLNTVVSGHRLTISVSTESKYVHKAPEESHEEGPAHCDNGEEDVPKKMEDTDDAIKKEAKDM